MKQDDETECDFCSGWQQLNDNYATVRMNGNQMIFDNSSSEYTPGRVKIKFCPMCGKLL